MWCLGVDPGVNGAWALLDGTKVVDAGPLTIVRHPCGIVTVDSTAIADALYPADALAIEAVLPSALGTGVNAVRVLATIAGSIVGIAGLMGKKISVIPSMRWKSHFGLVGRDKTEAIAVVEATLGWRPESRRKALRIAMAEAALIAATVTCKQEAKDEKPNPLVASL